VIEALHEDLPDPPAHRIQAGEITSAIHDGVLVGFGYGGVLYLLLALLILIWKAPLWGSLILVRACVCFIFHRYSSDVANYLLTIVNQTSERWLTAAQAHLLQLEDRVINPDFVSKIMSNTIQEVSENVTDEATRALSDISEQGKRSILLLSAQAKQVLKEYKLVFGAAGLAIGFALMMRKTQEKTQMSSGFEPPSDPQPAKVVYNNLPRKSLVPNAHKTTQVGDLIGLVSRNLKRVCFHMETQTPKLGQMLFVHGKYVIMPAHYVPKLLRGGNFGIEILEDSLDGACGLVKNVVYPVYQSVFSEKLDLMMFTLDGCLPAKSLLHHFKVAGDRPRLTSGFYVTYNVGGQLTTESVSCQQRSFHDSEWDLDLDGFEIRGPEGCYPGYDGQCGAILCTPGDGTYIYGIHTHVLTLKHLVVMRVLVGFNNQIPREELLLLKECLDQMQIVPNLEAP
jgi:hypothetical protein